MYNGKSIRLGNTTFNSPTELTNFFHIKQSYPPIIIKNHLRKLAPFWEHSYLSEALLYQDGTVYIKNSGTFSAPSKVYGFNPTKYSHAYLIDDIISAEIHLAVLDFLNSIKYCLVCTTALSTIGGLFLAFKENHDITRCESLPPIPEEFKIDNLQTAANSTTFFRHKLKFSNSGDIFNNNTAKRKLSTFLHTNAKFLEKFGLHEVGKSFHIPVSETYLLFLFFALNQEELSLTDIGKYNNYILEQIENDAYSESQGIAAIYRSSLLFNTSKLNIIQKYYIDLTSATYKEKLRTTYGIDNPEKIIKEYFFNSGFINQFLVSDWPDCYIFIKYNLDVAILQSSYRFSTLQRTCEKIRDDLRFHMQLPFYECYDSLVHAASVKLLWQNACNITKAENAIITDLKKNPYFKTVYMTETNTQTLKRTIQNFSLTNSDIIRIT